MYTENANRATSNGVITPNNFEPNPKNPIIAAFFRNIWLADELGSGVRRLYRYVPLYSGKEPQLIDGDVFRVTVSLDDNYSFDVSTYKAQNKAQLMRNGNGCTISETAVYNYLYENPGATQLDVANAIGKSRRTVQDTISNLKDKGLLEREGARKNGLWIVKK
jgi:ATP-dependent DNA helicase RecG